MLGRQELVNVIT